MLADVVGESGGSATPLALGEVRALLADRLQGRPTRTNFRTGSLTVCTLVPMRSVPHRVVCLLGLDDGEFPRKAPRDGDDLVLREPHVGDRDARTEDRQMLLDALMAATDRLIVTYTGNDERTNARRPPAVPVGELLDVVDRTARAGGEARDRVLVRHPLQPFDPRNFAGRRAPWGFDRTMLDGAEALAGERPEPGAVPARARCSPPGEAVVEVEDLVRFARHPVRAFLRRRLGVTVAEYDDEVEDALPIELDGLERWSVGERMLQARLAGAERRGAILAEIARGTLPPGALGRPEIERVEPDVDAIVEQVREAHAGRGRARSTCGSRVGGRLISGTVPDVCGDVLRTVTLLAREPAPPDRRLGAAARAHRGAPGPRVRGDHDRPGHAAGAGSRGRPDRAARRGRGARAARDRARPVRPRDARAAAAVLRDVGGVGAGAPRGRGPGARGRGRRGSRRGTSPRRTRSPSTRSCSAGSRRSRSCSRSRRAPARTGPWTSAPGSGATRGGCGTGCWSASR